MADYDDDDMAWDDAGGEVNN